MAGKKSAHCLVMWFTCAWLFDPQRATNALAAAVRLNTSLTHLDISWNDVSFADFNLIDGLVNENRARFEGAHYRGRLGASL